jgi:hypothetical protein
MELTLSQLQSVLSRRPQFGRSHPPTAVVSSVIPLSSEDLIALGHPQTTDVGVEYLIRCARDLVWGSDLMVSFSLA